MAKAVTDCIIKKITQTPLKAKFYSKVKNLIEEQALKLKPVTITDKDWIYLVK